MRSHSPSPAPSNRAPTFRFAQSNARRRALPVTGSTWLGSRIPVAVRAGRRHTNPVSNPLSKRLLVKHRISSLLILSLVITFLALGHAAWGQTQLPVLRASSPTLSIRAGDSFYQHVWTISPQDSPDVFTTNPFRGQQRVVFYSNRDSLAVVMRPGRTYDFGVLLNATDSAFTRISARTWLVACDTN